MNTEEFRTDPRGLKFYYWGALISLVTLWAFLCEVLTTWKR